MYLRISNPGLANPDSLITMGISTTRYSKVDGLVGQFGSGIKNSISLFLRNHVHPIVYIGSLQMHFKTKPIKVEDNIFNKVIVKYGGKDFEGKSRSNTEETGFSAEMGEVDWTDFKMGLREFVSNAIDGCLRNNRPFSEVEIDFVEKPRAKENTTQIFIPVTDNRIADIVSSFYQELNERFLHFREDNCLKMALLPKTSKDVVRIYKKGVMVLEIPNTISLFDYNIGDELKLDESRNANEWTVRYAIAMTIAKNATQENIQYLLENMNKDPNIWENKLDKEYLMGKYSIYGDEKEKLLEKWKMSWDNVYGKKAVACGGARDLGDFVSKKGFSPVTVTNDLLVLLDMIGVKTQNSVLNGLEQKGRTINEPTKEMLEVVDEVWVLLKNNGMLNGKQKPAVKGFFEVMEAGSQCFGEYLDDVVYLHNELGGEMLYKVALEEVVHCTTMAFDGSRDFQDYLLRLICKLVHKKGNDLKQEAA